MVHERASFRTRRARQSQRFSCASSDQATRSPLTGTGLPLGAPGGAARPPRGTARGDGGATPGAGDAAEGGAPAAGRETPTGAQGGRRQSITDHIPTEWRGATLGFLWLEKFKICPHLCWFFLFTHSFAFFSLSYTYIGVEMMSYLRAHPYFPPIGYISFYYKCNKGGWALRRGFLTAPEMMFGVL